MDKTSKLFFEIIYLILNKKQQSVENGNSILTTEDNILFNNLKTAISKSYDKVPFKTYDNCCEKSLDELINLKINEYMNTYQAKTPFNKLQEK